MNSFAMRQTSVSDSPGTIASSILLQRLTELAGSKRVPAGGHASPVCAQDWARNWTGQCRAVGRSASAKDGSQFRRQSSKAGANNLCFNAFSMKNMVGTETGEIGKQIAQVIIDIIPKLDGPISTKNSIGRTKAGWSDDTLPARHLLLPGSKTDVSPCTILKPDCLLGRKGKRR